MASYKPKVHNVYVYNVPPGCRWRDVKRLLAGTVVDSNILHIQILAESQAACVSLSDAKSATAVLQALEGFNWDGYVLATAPEEVHEMYRYHYTQQMNYFPLSPMAPQVLQLGSLQGPGTHIGPMGLPLVPPIGGPYYMPYYEPSPQQHQLHLHQPQLQPQPPLQSPTSTPTISTRQLDSLHQYPYHSITDVGKATDKKRLFIGNIPYRAGWMDLKDFLRQCGNILRVEIPTDMNGAARGFALATFERDEEAERAIETLNGAMFQGRNLSIRWDKYGKKPQEVTSVRYTHKENTVDEEDNKRFDDAARSLIESLSLNKS